MKLVMIAAGGTGGHIYPALSFAEQLKQEGITSVFVGSDDRLEAGMIPKAGYEFIPLHLPTPQGGITSKMVYGWNMAKTYFRCRTLLQNRKPDACVGFGNYISVPLILAAHHLKIPVMISEQNSFAGKANVFLGRYADAVELAYESSARDFDSSRTKVLGNPRSLELRDAQKDENLIRSYGVDPDRPFVAVMMGSLGSASMSEVIDQACDLFGDFQVLISVGMKNDYTFHCQKENVHTLPYIDGSKVLLSCDLAVCRAGATTLAELAMAECPAVLIPSPFVPNNHQVYNAMELVEKGAAVMIEERDLTPQKLADTVNGLMNDEQARNAMRRCAAELAKPDAAKDMTEWLKEICRK